MSRYMQVKIVVFRMWCHVLWWLVTNVSEECNTSIPFYPEGVILLTIC